MNIIDLNHMTNLKILYANGNNGLTDDGIKNLNLVHLFVDKNSNITNINHMTNLNHITNLEILSINSNSKIIDITNLTNLKILRAESDCNINNDDIKICFWKNYVFLIIIK
jgi:hypothetical protein